MTVPAAAKKWDQVTIASATATVNTGIYATDKTWLSVSRTRSGVDTVLSVDTDYTVGSLGASGGCVLTMIGQAASDIITTTLSVPSGQQSNYPTGTSIDEQEVENDLDELELKIQQVEEKYDRALKMPITATQAQRDGATIDLNATDGTVLTQGAGGVGIPGWGDVPTFGGTEKVYSNRAAMAAATGLSTGTRAVVLGESEQFQLINAVAGNPESSSPVDNQGVGIDYAGSSQVYWKRQFTGDEYDIRWFGGISTDYQDDASASANTLALSAAVTYLASIGGGKILIPRIEGKWFYFDAMQQISADGIYLQLNGNVGLAYVDNWDETSGKYWLSWNTAVDGWGVYGNGVIDGYAQVDKVREFGAFDGLTPLHCGNGTLAAIPKNGYIGPITIQNCPLFAYAFVNADGLLIDRTKTRNTFGTVRSDSDDSGMNQDGGHLYNPRNLTVMSVDQEGCDDGIAITYNEDCPHEPENINIIGGRFRNLPPQNVASAGLGGSGNAGTNRYVLANAMRMEINVSCPYDFKDLKISSPEIYDGSTGLALRTNRIGNVIAFTSGSSEPDVRDVIEGATSGATATVAYIDLVSGTWGGGNAAGFIILAKESGTFQAEDINISGGATNVLTCSGAAADIETTTCTIPLKIIKPVITNPLIRRTSNLFGEASSILGDINRRDDAGLWIEGVKGGSIIDAEFYDLGVRAINITAAEDLTITRPKVDGIVMDATGKAVSAGDDCAIYFSNTANFTQEQTIKNVIIDNPRIWNVDGGAVLAEKTTVVGNAEYEDVFVYDIEYNNLNVRNQSDVESSAVHADGFAAGEFYANIKRAGTYTVNGAAGAVGEFSTYKPRGLVTNVTAWSSNVIGGDIWTSDGSPTLTYETEFQGVNDVLKITSSGGFRGIEATLPSSFDGDALLLSGAIWLESGSFLFRFHQQTAAKEITDTGKWLYFNEIEPMLIGMKNGLNRDFEIFANNVAAVAYLAPLKIEAVTDER